MPGMLLHVGITATCPHGGQVSVAPGQPRVTLGGQPAATMGDQFPIAACPFQVPVGTATKPQPCVKVLWTVPAMRVRVGGQFVLLSASTGICQSAEQIPAGPPSVSVTQQRVKGM
jgi:hypothetical protein